MRDLTGKHCLITGASSGIGRVTAVALAERGAKVWLACRDHAKTSPVVDAIVKGGGDAQVLPLDLSDLESVSACAQQFLEQHVPLHVLINNAGLAGRRGVTKQGFELAFGVNHLGHFLLTQLLLPRLLEQPASRVVNVASIAHYDAPGIDYEALRRQTSLLGVLRAYQVSKLANVLHAKSLADHYGPRGLRAYSLHPGVIASDVWREVPQPLRWLMLRNMLSNEQGAQTTLYCATSPEVAQHNGRYYDDCREKQPSVLAQDSALRDELWRNSLEYVARWT